MMKKIFFTTLLLMAADVLSAPVFGPPEGEITDAEPFGDGAIILLEFGKNGTDIDEWSAYIGTTPGAFDLHRITHMNRYDYPGPETEELYVGIPADGSTFYIRFWWFDRDATDNGWQYVDYEYVAPDFN